MKRLPIALLLSGLAMSVGAVEGQAVAKVFSQEAAVKADQTLRVGLDRGELNVAPGEPGKLSYQVEWKPSRSRSFFKSDKDSPTQKDYDDCSAAYSAEKGLEIKTGERIEAVVTVRVPQAQPLEVKLDAGVLEMGKLTGKLSAHLDRGTMKYDGRALPAGACVDATVKTGGVENKRDEGCKTTLVTLRARTGLIAVK